MYLKKINQAVKEDAGQASTSLNFGTTSTSVNFGTNLWNNFTERFLKYLNPKGEKKLNVLEIAWTKMCFYAILGCLPVFVTCLKAKIKL